MTTSIWWVKKKQHVSAIVGLIKVPETFAIGNVGWVIEVLYCNKLLHIINAINKTGNLMSHLNIIYNKK